jgi:hypothetical protein
MRLWVTHPGAPLNGQLNVGMTLDLWYTRRVFKYWNREVFLRERDTRPLCSRDARGRTRGPPPATLISQICHYFR